MTVEQFYLTIFFTLFAPFLSAFIIFRAYRSALKSNDPYEAYGLNSGRAESAGGAIILSWLCSTMVYISIPILMHKYFSFELIANLTVNQIVFMFTTTLCGILNFPVISVQAYLLGHKLQKKFPEKITKRQINKDILTSVCMGVCCIAFLACLLFYRP